MKTAEQRKIDDRPCRTSNEDLMNRALKNYEEASRVAHHWDSNIPKAIKFYFKHKEIEQGEEKMKKYLNKPLTEKERKIAHNTWLESQFEDTDKRKRVKEFCKANINPRLDKNYDVHLTGEELFNLLLEFSQQREVTDDEIEEWAEKWELNDKVWEDTIMPYVKTGLKEGAKAMRDGKIGEQIK